MSGPDYFERALAVLDEPDVLWRVAFERHLSPDAQAVLLVLASLPTRVEYDDLRAAWAAYCDDRQLRRDVGAYDRSLATLEGSFISIQADGPLRFIRYANPSVADFMVSYLDGEDDHVQAIARSARFFNQLETLYQFAYEKRWNYRLRRVLATPRQGMRRALESAPAIFVKSVQRLFLSEGPRWGWDASLSVVSRLDVSLEARMLFVLALPESFSLTPSWVEEQIVMLESYWINGEGNKETAVKLEGRLRTLTIVSPSRRASCQSTLRTWLATRPQNMDDWAPLLDFAVETMSPRDRLDISNAFRDFARDELEAWSPTPPDFEQITEYLERFGIEDLAEDIEAAQDRAREADREAASDNDSSSRPASKPQIDPSDEAIEALFANVSTWNA